MATKINYSEHLIGSSSNLQQADLAEIIAEIKATNMFLTEDNVGKQRLSIESGNLKDENGQPMRLVIALGASVVLTEEEPLPRIKELINNYTIYTSTKDKSGKTITNDEGKVIRWFSFGKPTTDLEKAPKVSVADLMAEIKAASKSKA